MRKLFLLSAAVVTTAALSLTAVTTGVAEAASGSGGGAGTAPVPAAGASSTATRPSLSTSPTVFDPPNALCTSIGYTFPNSTAVTGTNFAPSTAFTVRYHGRLSASGTTSGSGGISATVDDFSQPDGYYPMRAVAGATRKGISMYSSGDTCANERGHTTMHWRWQGVGFDANTSASLLLSGAVVQTTTTDTKGAFRLSFVTTCTSRGNQKITFQGYFGGVLETFGTGHVWCK